MSLLKELKRRNVFRVAVGYIASGWLLVQVADLVLEQIGSPAWVLQTILLVLALGFPVVLFFSWAYEVTPEGLKRESEVDRTQSITHLTALKLDRAIIAVLIIALAYFTLEEFYLAARHGVQQAEVTAPTVTAPQAIEELPAADSEPSIAVLPFVNMSGDADNEYFSDGLSEEILNLLAKVSGLKVIARTSSFAFKGKNQDLREVGEALGVNNVLEGSVRKSGERVRITAQLIKVADGSHIWSDSYDRTLTDIFQIQDEVAGAIVDALQVHVGTRPERGRPTKNLDAYDLFLQAKAPGLFYGKQARQYLHAAISLDPQFAEAHEFLALSYWMQSGVSITSSDGQRLTFEAAERALALDPSLAMARALSQSADLENFSWLGELQAMEQLVREQPSNASALDMLTYDLVEAGYLQEAFRMAQRLIALDPLYDGAKQRFSETLISVGRPEEAMTSTLHQQRGDLYFFSGQYNLAADEYAAGFKLAGLTDTAWVTAAVEKGRDPVAGQEYLDTLIPDKLASLPDDRRLAFWRTMVNWYAVFGHLDRFMEIIQSLDLTSSTWTEADWLVYLATVERAYTGFTAHPDYVKVAGAIGLVEVWDQRGAPDFCHKEDGKWLCK